MHTHTAHIAPPVTSHAAARKLAPPLFPPEALSAVIDAVIEGFQRGRNRELEYAIMLVGDIPPDQAAVGWMAEEIVRLRARAEAAEAAHRRMVLHADQTIIAEILGTFPAHQLLDNGRLQLGVGPASQHGVRCWVRGMIENAQPAIDECRRELAAMAARDAGKVGAVRP